MSQSILEVNQLSKTYQSGSRSLTVLHDISFALDPGATCSIVGPSGSGKTTLLGLCAGLDRASSGSVILNGVRLDQLNEDERAEVRGQHVGFIFQSFNLMPTLTALENVMVPLELRGEKNVDRYALELLEKVGLADRQHHYPSQLSGGEQQRVSIARAFSNRPKILFADEPTGNLDEETGQHIEALIFDLNREAGTTLVIVTHDLTLAEKTQRIIRIKGGRVAADTLTSETVNSEIKDIHG
uniref:ABC transporter ATP-binding protein n=1 Tax=Roseihalotalea indica TaxID=2867963 RepID=A0AA49GL91_9BACT|nr:ABC transporter ATP-binding protein [Tunicatimonas sp. TK19036]